VGTDRVGGVVTGLLTADDMTVTHNEVQHFQLRLLSLLNRNEDVSKDFRNIYFYRGVTYCSKVNMIHWLLHVFRRSLLLLLVLSLLLLKRVRALVQRRSVGS